MNKKVLSVGQCVPDDGALKNYLTTHFNVEFTRSPNKEDALAKIRTQPFDLITVNRKLDEDYSDGMEVIKSIQSDPDINTTPVMLVTNYPESQDEAVAAGAEYGFGKLEYNKPEVLERLKKYLG
ncbi:MAG TPA: hypothetical protein DD473_10805 [Planctomycetaceae bacterium]|nr:hypothetical protein [Planctomycetaceae bacterium]|tara:strand:- start:34 stop:405 length:372 start_codon:yes stop_codon:yes gene_type:complete